MAIAASERLFHPDDRVAVFIDGANLYQAAKALGFDIDYKRLLQTLAVDCRFIRAYYYTALLDEQEYSPIRPLVDWLDYNGYTMVTKPLKEFTQSTGRRKFKGNMDVEITVDVMEMSRACRPHRADLRRRRFPAPGRGGAAAGRARHRGEHDPHAAADGRRRAAAPGGLLPRPGRAAGSSRARVSGPSRRYSARSVAAHGRR